MKRATLILALVLMALGVMAKGREAVTFRVELHCQGCVDKIMKNIAYEKGVKDIVCDIDKQTVVVTFDPEKTTVEALQQAFAKIRKPATVCTPEQTVDAQSGATTVH